MALTRLTTDLLIAYYRMVHPDSKRSNNCISRSCWIEARTVDLKSKKLGKKESIFQGFEGLPKSSEELLISEEVFSHLFEFVRKGAWVSEQSIKKYGGSA